MTQQPYTSSGGARKRGLRTSRIQGLKSRLVDQTRDRTLICQYLLFLGRDPLFFQNVVSLCYFWHKNLSKMGNPKTKFLLLFLSAVRPSVRPKKTFPVFAPVWPPTSDLGPIQWGQSYTDFYVNCSSCTLFFGKWTSNKREREWGGKVRIHIKHW